jgi:NAD(P)-dependent dehydrogenase (short-subunit alcohol dehydrogenase family)
VRLDDKVAVITGGTGGMGLATTRRFLDAGARVVLADISADGARVADELRRDGGDAVFVQADVTSPPDVQRLMAEARSWGGQIDVLFNNAGIGPPTDLKVTEIAEEAWNQILAVNLTGVFLCCKYGIPYLVEGGGGSVVNTASIAGLRANTALPSTAYTVSKAGVIALTRQCAVDYAAQHVRVNCVCPGPIDTAIIAPYMTDAVVRERFNSKVPLGRIGQPTDVASLVLFLASEESSWITGSAMVIDGGITAG